MQTTCVYELGGKHLPSKLSQIPVFTIVILGGHRCYIPIKTYQTHPIYFAKYNIISPENTWLRAMQKCYTFLAVDIEFFQLADLMCFCTRNV